MNDVGRRLLLMRHARAEPAAAQDQARRLTARGHRDAAEAGEWAASAGLLPDYAVVSSAARAMATWEGFAQSCGTTVTPVVSEALYAADPASALEILRGASPEAQTVMLVGHNPTVAYLVQLLDDGGADPDAFRGISEGYPTAAVTVLSFPGDWSDLDTGTARIMGFHVGRG